MALLILDPVSLSSRLAPLGDPSDSTGSGVSCAVAMLLRNGGEGGELLLVQRARHPGDPWSGNLGFPGGKREESDPSLRHAAQRETLEEIGVDLDAARYLGYLGEIEGMHLPVRVACFVYLLADDPVRSLSAEIDDSFWVPLTTLFQTEGSADVEFRGETHRVPCFRAGTGRPILWGLTYRLIQRLRAILEEDS